MKPTVKIFVGIAASIVFIINSAVAQDSSIPKNLEPALRRSVSERIGGPLVFSTRDTLFALSLPTDEPATIYLQLTVGKNGKVKDKQTKIHANHMAQYVSPAFVEATKGLRIDRTLLEGMQRKDTSLLVEFPMEYVCAYDTVSRAWPYDGEQFFSPFYNLSDRYTPAGIARGPETFEQRARNQSLGGGAINGALWQYWRSEPTPIWYYIAFIKD